MPTGPVLNQQRERWARNQSTSLSATSTAPSATIVKQTQIPITATSASLNGSLVKLTKAILSAVGAAFNGSLIKKTLKSLVAVGAAFNGSLVKLTKIILSAVEAAFSGSLVKLTKAVLSAVNAAFNATLIKKTLKALAGVAAAFNGLIVKLTTVILSAVSAAFNGSLVKKTLKVLASVASAFSGALSKFKLHVQVLVASMTALSGSVVKKTLKSLSAVASVMSGIQSKFISRSLVASAAAFSGSVNKLTKKFFNALSSAWSAIVNAVKSAAPPPVFKPLVLGQTLRSMGVTFLTPAAITTASNSFQLFQYSGNQFLTVPGGSSLFEKPCRIVAGGSIVIPPSGINTAANFILTMKGFSQRTQPARGVLDDVMATLPSPQPISGTTPWQLIVKLSATQDGNTGPALDKRAGRLTAEWMININGVYTSGISISNQNPFQEALLYFSLGAQFTGSVSGADKFQANLYQFETQQ